MKEIIVSRNESGKKLFGFLCAHLPSAPGSVLHKSIRNKNIVINKKKAKEDDKLKEGDVVSIFFSDETFDKFCANEKKDEYIDQIIKVDENVDILYEDEDILAVYKPVGVLSQKSRSDDISINEMIISYLLRNRKIDEKMLRDFRPGIVNRLDRNTSGIVLFGKTASGLQFLNEGIKNRTIHKFYKARVIGKYEKTGTFDAYLIKDSRSNTVKVFWDYKEKSEKIATKIITCDYDKNMDTTDVIIELLTGKSHQIRAFMAFVGHPLVGDPKYGDKYRNQKLSVKQQMLVAYKVEIPQKGLVITTDGHME